MSEKTDPFAKEKAIRKGELPLPSFNELTSWLGVVPKTWLPALLIRIVQLCALNKVFNDGGLVKVVQDIENKTQKPIGLRGLKED